MESWEGREHEDQEVDSSDSFVTVEISGLSLFTHHGATEAEQQTGQRLVFDITFEVEDCDATAAKAKELGAEIHMEPLDMPGAGRFAFLKDPYGAFFYVIKPSVEGDVATTGS